jgi:hypothetical protein
MVIRWCVYIYVCVSVFVSSRSVIRHTKNGKFIGVKSNGVCVSVYDKFFGTMAFLSIYGFGLAQVTFGKVRER